MTLVKICGITRLEDAIIAIENGVDYLGLIFASSPREVSLDRAQEIIEAVSEFRSWVGVFVDTPAPTILKISKRLGLRVVQLHGSESIDESRLLQKEGLSTIKAFRVQNKVDLDRAQAYDSQYVLLDSYSENQAGGTGKTFDWDLLDQFEEQDRLFLSGGITPQNIGEAIQKVSPYAIDCSSGVEKAPGIKDHEKMKSLIAAVKGAPHG